MQIQLKPGSNETNSPLTHNKQDVSLFSKTIFSLFSWIFLLWFFWLFISLCFINNSTFEYDFLLQSIAALLLAGGTYLGYAGVRRIRSSRPSIKHWMKRRFILIFCTGMAILFICQMVYVGLVTTSIGWDCGTLIRNAKAPDMGTTIDYFHQYPNNLFLLLFDRFFVLVFAFFKLPGVWAGLNVINVIAIDVAIILTVLAARRLFGLRGAYIAWFFCTVTLAFFPYLIVPYSDTMGMPFAIAIFYCYLRICDGKTKKERILFCLIMGTCACIGYLIKPTIVIPVIAIVLIHLLFHLKNKKRLLKSAVYFSLVLATFLTVTACYQGFTRVHFPQDKEKETPLTHFAMMGLQETKLPNGTSMYGAYYRQDVKNTFAQPTKEEKIAFNLKVIQQRLEEKGPLGYLQYLNNKARWITSEGNFFWGGEGGFANFDYMTDCFIKELINPGSNRLGYYMREDGKTQPGQYFNLYFYFSQAVWILLMFCITAPLFLKKKGSREKGVLILRCSIFGLMLFLLLFEGRSRYLINQLPYFILLASFGLNQIIAMRKKEKHSKQKTQKFPINHKVV